MSNRILSVSVRDATLVPAEAIVRVIVSVERLDAGTEVLDGRGFVGSQELPEIVEPPVDRRFQFPKLGDLDFRRLRVGIDDVVPHGHTSSIKIRCQTAQRSFGGLKQCARRSDLLMDPVRSPHSADPSQRDDREQRNRCGSQHRE